MTTIILALIGLIPNLVLLYLLKSTRLKYYARDYKETDIPVLNLGGLIVILLLTWIPYVNIIEFMALF